MAKTSFLSRVLGLYGQSSNFRMEVRVEPLLSFGHLTRMPSGCLPEEVFQTCSTEKRPQADTEEDGWIFHISFGLKTLVFSQRMEDVARDGMSGGKENYEIVFILSVDTKTVGYIVAWENVGKNIIFYS